MQKSITIRPHENINPVFLILLGNCSLLHTCLIILSRIWRKIINHRCRCLIRRSCQMFALVSRQCSPDILETIGKWWHWSVKKNRHFWYWCISCFM